MRTYSVFEENDTVVKNPKYQVLNSRRGAFYFRLCARNGEIVLTSVEFGSKGQCLQVLNNIKDKAEFEFVEVQDDQRKLFSFNLENPGLGVVGKSENYTTKLGRGNGIMSVMRIICEAPTEDLT